MTKIVVMGGSFSPPTIAHQRLLDAVKEPGAEEMLHPKVWEILMENGGMRK